MIPGDVLSEGLSLTAFVRAGIVLAVWAIATYYLEAED